MKADFAHFSSELDAALALPGDVIELGVFHGDTFVPLAIRARGANRRSYGIDSFVGFPAAHPVHDRTADGMFHYDLGQFNAGGHAEAERIRSLCPPTAILLEGFVPDVLDKVPADARFCFAHVDLDLYVPTLEALIWLWPRMTPGGVIACHDWFPAYKCLASLAIRNFCHDKALTVPPDSPVRYAFLTKGAA